MIEVDSYCELGLTLDGFFKYHVVQVYYAYIKYKYVCFLEL